jgi:hypothetical protein
MAERPWLLRRLCSLSGRALRIMGLWMRNIDELDKIRHYDEQNFATSRSALGRH